MAEAVQFHAERRAAPFCIDVKDIPQGPEAKVPDAYFAFMQIEPRRTEDRVPMSPVHGAAMRDSATAFAHHFRGQAVEVYEDVPLRYLKRNKRGLVRPAHLYPDVLVRLGIPHSLVRRRYDLNKLGPPDFVLEVLSLSTWRYDLGHKLNLYALVGVRECFFFEPTGELPAGGELQGFALSRSGKRRLPLKALPNGKLGLCSKVLGLCAYVADERLSPQGEDEGWALSIRWYDPEAGADIPSYEEWVGACAAAEARAETANARAEVAEAQTEVAMRRAAELEETVRHLQAGSG